ncbi:DUF1045 domain-containing protein [Methylobrevis albus]|uniref:DUF1045 domain-containing protein n=1 Tax=Methylobrevis albus TaxID=2793297 RepID=A0A931I476_9HYPH|nr:DUF1045 domain-containing protein [Methylobrevis albus]MBH0238558.1 DUF1045 domain-containing protein [Methylobrevis albus]
MRYALYFTPPPGDDLARLGARWLGRDAFTGAATAQPEIAGLDAEAFAEITAEPRRYGFHGTLKAPFALHEGQSEVALFAAAEAFARATPAFEAGPMHVADLRGFLAVVPAGPAPDLDGFAAACVEAFEPFRAPLSPAQLARRHASGLTPRQADYVDRWGYPYVFEEFRFHMTLTRRLEPDLARTVLAAAAAHFGVALADPVRGTHLAIFVERAPGAPFEVAALFPLAGGEGKAGA